MERCECILNRLMAALESLANTLINHQESNRLSFNDSGNQMTTMESPNLSNNNLLSMTIVALIMFTTYLRFRDRSNQNQNENGLLSLEKRQSGEKTNK